MFRLMPDAVDWRLLPEDDENSSFRDSIAEDSVSMQSKEDIDDDDVVSDCESVVSGNRVVEDSKIEREVAVNGLIRLDRSDKMYEIIEKRFVSGLSVDGVDARVECVHRNVFNAGAIALARLRSFQIFTKAVEKKNGGDANVKYAWFGGSKDEIDTIILHGFSKDNIKNNGNGVVLAADHSPLQSVKSTSINDDGARHVLLCRVLLGKPEVVNRYSTQCHPSSEDFQSGVDNLESPKSFVVWSTHMNSHILPEFVVSFKTLSGINGPRIDQVRLEKKPVSPWIPIPALIVALSKILPSEAMKEISRYRRSYIERKISRRDMIQGIREFAGDKLLLMVLKEFRDKQKLRRTGNQRSESKSD